METWMLIAAGAVVAILLILLVAAWLKRRNDTARLRQNFGTEYDRAVVDYGGERQAQRALHERQERVSKFEVRPLSPEDQRRFSGAWEALQTSFIDDPRGAVVQADTLVQQVLQRRGYPVADFDRNVEDLSVDHGEVLDHYRSAHAVAVKRDEASTESLREAVVHYRALFSELLRT